LIGVKTTYWQIFE